MSIATLLSVLILYPLALLGDGCILIAIALAATVSGRAWLWGLSFGLFHTLYGVLGIIIASEVAEYSEMLGELFVLGGALFLLWHFMHHRVHHRMQGDCSCENHPAISVRPITIISTAAALSLHALAGGAVIRNITGELSDISLMVLISAASLMVGGIISIIVLLGDSERGSILKALDKLPGVVAFILSGVSFWCLYQFVSKATHLSNLISVVFVVAALALSIALGYSVHERSTNKVVRITPRQYR